MRLSPVVKFFALTFAFSWACWIGAAALASRTQSSGPLLSSLSASLLFLGALSPSFVAVLLAVRSEGKAGVIALLSRLFDGQVAVSWYLFAIGFGAAIRLTSAVVFRVITGSWPALGMESIFIIAAAIIIGLPFAAGEEVGWRGYALPRMASASGFARAGLVLGLIHASWHLPLFYFPGHVLFGQSFLSYLLLVTALSVVFTWLYLNTGGSLLLATLFHSAWNQTTGLVRTQLSEPGNPLALDTQLISILVGALTLAFAAYCLVRISTGAARESVIG
jgi:membrane protease YdiL (CAAX protease family)